MASPIQNVALCFATGKIGPVFRETLEAEGLAVTVIARQSSKATFPAGQKVIRISDDYAESDLIAAFKTVDAVVLSLPFQLLSESKRFAQASIAAGNRWFIASTYGSNLDDPRADLFPASPSHRQIITELRELQKGQDRWTWTAITCGLWPETAIAANAWHIDTVNKTAELVDGGVKGFSCTTRAQLGRAAARIFKKEPTTMKNANIYVASFEENMLAWLDAHKKLVGQDGWEVTSTDSEAMIAQSQEHLAKGEFIPGYTKAALATCTGKSFDNKFSDVAVLANKELDLPKEDLLEVVRTGLSLPNPFGHK